jgi:hypothetical protein
MDELAAWITDMPSYALWLSLCIVLFCFGLLVGRHRTRFDRQLDQRAIDFGSGVTRKVKVGQIVFEQDYLLTIYETDYKYLDIYPSTHIMEVPCSVSAASFSVGILLTVSESIKIEERDWRYFETLAQQVQENHFRFKNFPIDAPPKFSI